MSSVLCDKLKSELMLRGASLVGFADITMLPEYERCGMPFGVAVAVRYEKSVIKGIADRPTSEYYDAYNLLNKKLDMLVTFCSEWLREAGYDAIPRTIAFVGESETDYGSLHPHKTVARLAGLGWIGKSALFVTEKYGSMIRLSSVLTNAPLELQGPIDESKCGDCIICTNMCPAGAVSGINWTAGCERDDIFDAVKCRKTARELSDKYISSAAGTICGKCIYVCPYTQKYLKSE